MTENFEKMTSEELRQIIGYTDNEKLIYDIENELNRRNRAAIFKSACVCLRNCGRNQFEAAATFADAVIDDDPSYFPTVDHFEIGSYYTKTKNPVTVYF